MRFDAFELDEANASSQTTSFVGRAEALSRLRQAYGIASTGKRTIVWVAGEPGIGKNTLIDHFVGSLGDVVCVRGQCVELGGAVKLHPLMVVIGVFSGALLFGVVGVLLAIPTIVVLKVFVSSTARQLKAYGLID